MSTKRDRLESLKVVLKVVVVITGISIYFVDEKSLLELVKWLSWVLPVTITCAIALLIISLWAPTRLITGSLLIILSILSAIALFLISGIMVRFAWSKTMVLLIALIPPHFWWFVCNIIIGIYEGGWWLTVLWLVIDIAVATAGYFLINHSLNISENNEAD